MEEKTALSVVARGLNNDIGGTCSKWKRRWLYRVVARGLNNDIGGDLFEMEEKTALSGCGKRA